MSMSEDASEAFDERGGDDFAASEAVEVEISAPSPIAKPLDAKPSDAFFADYLETLSTIERLHRLMLDVIKDEFERIGKAEINSVQGLLLFHIGADELTQSDLRIRGYYLGSNVSYNMKQLQKRGYLDMQKCKLDGRARRIKATAKGLEIHRIVGQLFDRHARAILENSIIDRDASKTMLETMHRLEQFWRVRIRFIY